MWGRLGKGSKVRKGQRVTCDHPNPAAGFKAQAFFSQRHGVLYGGGGEDIAVFPGASAGGDVSQGDVVTLAHGGAFQCWTMATDLGDGVAVPAQSLQAAHVVRLPASLLAGQRTSRAVMSAKDWTTRKVRIPCAQNRKASA